MKTMTRRLLPFLTLSAMMLGGLTTAQEIPGLRGNPAQRDIEVFIDRDTDMNTGCDVMLDDGTPISGIDLVLNIRIQTGTAPQVVGLNYQECEGTTFGTARPASGLPYAISLNAGVGGADSVEAMLSVTPLGVTGQIQLYVQASDPNDGDFDLMPDNPVLGPDILYVFPVPIPTLSEWMLLIYLAGMAVAALWLIRRRRRLGPGATSAVALFLAILLFGFSTTINVSDGTIADWAGVPQLAGDSTGEGSTNNDEAVDLVAAFACNDSRFLYFRIDLVDVESAPPVAVNDSATVDEGGTVTQLDSGATSVLTNDSDPNGANLSVTTTPVTGVANGTLTLNTDGTFSYTHDGSKSVSDFFVYEVCNDLVPSLCSTARVDITINPINDCPIPQPDSLTTDEDTLSNDNLFADNGNGPDSDAEGDPLNVIAVNGNAADVGVQITLPSGALLTVNADGTSAYDPNGQFENLDVGGSDTDSFTYTIDDGSGGCSETTTVTLTITGVNDCPTAVDDNVTVDKDIAFNGDVLIDNGNGPDTDPESNPLIVTAVNGNAASVGTQITLSSNVLLTLNANGTFTYDPNGQFQSLAPGETTTDSFTYTIDDGSGSCAETATVNVTITGNNDCPVAVDDAVTTDEDTLLNGDVLAANPTAPDSDPEGDTITVTAVNGNTADVGVQVTLGSGALLTLNANGTFAYDPNGAFDSLVVGAPDTDTFTYTVDDGSTSCAETATVTVTIIGVNDCPTAVDDAVSTDEDTLLNGDVLVANPTTADSDPEGDTMTVRAVNGGAGNVGTQITLGSGALLTVNANGTFAYDPNGAFDSLAVGASTTDTFTYTIDDGFSGCAETATVTVTINGVNDCPTAVDDMVGTDEDTLLNGNILVANPTTADSDPEGDTMTVTAINGGAGNVGVQITLGSGALLTVNANGTFAYDPNGAFDSLAASASTTDTFTYTIDDGSGGCSETATVTVTITGINDCPTAVDDAVSTDEDTLLNGDVLAANPTTADSDPEGDTLTVTAVNGGAANIGVQITLGSGALLTVNANGTFAYDPNGQFNTLAVGASTTDSFTYTIDDGSGGCSETATVTVTINGVNDCPTAVNDAVGTLANMVLNGDVLVANPTTADSDPEGDTLNVTAVNGGAGNVGVQITLGSGALVTVNANGTFSYDPNGVFNTLPSGNTTTDSFTYTIDDGSGGCSETATVTVTITGANSPPMVVDETFNNLVGNTTHEFANTSAITHPRTLATGDVLDNDTDSDGPNPLSISTFDAASVQGGTIAMNMTTGEFVYTPPLGYEGADSFTYTVTDGQDTAVGTVNLTIGDMVWYIDNNTAGGDGRAGTPFNTIAAFMVAQNAAGATDPETTDKIFIHAGAGNYGAGLVLQDGQEVIGQGNNLIVNAVNLLLTGGNPTAVNGPNLTGTADLITLANDNIIRGLRLAPTQGSGIVGNNNGGTHSLDHVTIAPSGTGTGINLTQFSGTFNTTNSIFNGTATTGSGIAINNSTGTFNFTDMTVLNVGVALDVDQGTPIINFNSSGGIDQSSGTGIDITNVTGGSLTFNPGTNIDVDGTAIVGVRVAPMASSNIALGFNDFTINTSGGQGAFTLEGLGAGSTVTFTGSTHNITGAGTTGLAILNCANTMNFPATMSIAGATNQGLQVFQGAPTVTYPGTLGNTAGLAIAISQTTGGNVQCTNTVTHTGGAGLLIENNGGDASFSDLDLGTGGSRLNGIGISLQNNTGTYSFTSDVFTNGATAAEFNTGGTATFTGSTLNALEGFALNSNGTTVGGTLVDVQAINSNGGGLRLLNVGSNPINITTGAISATNGTAIDISNTVIGAGGITFTGVTATNTGANEGIDINSLSGGTFTVTGTARVNNSGQAGIEISGCSNPFSINLVDVVTTTGVGISLSNQTGTFTISGAGSVISGTTGTAFLVDGGNQNATYNGTINNAAGLAVDVANRSGGTLAFNSAISDNGASNAGILVRSQTVGTPVVTFGGSSALTNTSGAGVRLDNVRAGTVNFSNLTIDNSTANQVGIRVLNGTTGGTLNTTTGTVNGGTAAAAFIENANLGVNLMSINSVGGAQAGLILNGTTGSFTVAGDGSNNQNGSGGQVENKTGNGIELTNAAGVTLSSLEIRNNSTHGLSANGASGLNLRGAQIVSNGNAVAEQGLFLRNLGGMCVFDNIQVNGNAENGIDLENSTANLTSLLIDNSTLENHGGAFGTHGMRVRSTGNTTMNITVEDSTLTNNASRGFIHTSSNTSNASVTLRRNTITSNNNAIDIGIDGSGDLDFNILNNTGINGHPSTVINVLSSTASSGTLEGRINGNTIGTGAVQSGSVSGSGIRVDMRGQTAGVIEIDGNTVNNIGVAAMGGRAIEATARLGTGGLDLSVTGNTVTNESDFIAAIFINSDDNNPICLDIRNNDATANGTSIVPFGGAYRIGEGDAMPGVLNMEGFMTDLATTLTNRGNTGTPVSPVGTIGAAAGSCTNPSNPIP